MDERTRSSTVVITESVTSTTVVNTYEKYREDDNDYSTSVASRTSEQSTVQSTMVDIETPDFYKRMKRGEIFNNPMSKSLVTTVNPSAQKFERRQMGEFTDLDGNYYTSGTVQTGSLPMRSSELGSFLSDEGNGSIIASEKSNAIQKAYARCDSSEISSLSALAESKKTVSSVALILQRVINIALAVKRLDEKRLVREFSSKELAARYMELRYAIRPLIYDARDTMAAVAKTDSYKDSRMTMRGFGSCTFDDSDTIVLSPWTSGSWKHTVDRMVTSKSDIRAGVLCDVELSALSVWGMDMPIEMLWEISPFSFIFDWFFNIGQAIAAWTPNVGIQQLASWVVTKTSTTYENVSALCENTASGLDYQNVFDWGGRKSITVHSVTREPNPPLSIFPRFDVNLDALKLLDLGIILTRLARAK